MADTPQDAATLVLIRDPIDAGSTPEVLLVKRRPEAAGVPEAYTLPGGQLTPTDTIPSALALSRTFTAAEAALRLPDVQPASRALGFWVAALRTTFEQTGLLLARYGDGRLWEPAGLDVQRLIQHRQAIQQGKTNFPNMMHDLERALATDLLVYFAHAVIPQMPAQRFSTRFFLAYMPASVPSLPAQHTVEAPRWVTTAEALRRQGNGALTMLPVTTHLLQLLQPFSSAAAAVEHFSRQPVDLVG